MRTINIARLNSWLAFLAPSRCVFCGDIADSAQICAPCRTALPRIGSRCPHCALPTIHGEVCGACLTKKPPFAMTLAACRYTFPLDRLIQDFKYGKKLVLAKPLAHLLVDAYRERQADDFRPDILVAMPLSRSRQIERGFNQAQEIARNLAHTLRLPLINNALVRTADAPKQATLPWRERHKNVRNAFACSSSVAGLHVALIDDVMTSGATASAAAHELRRAGAVNVDIWVVARAVVNTVG